MLQRKSSKTGIVHTIDILAIRDDVAAKHIIGINILVAKLGETEIAIEELFDFETKAYNIGVHDKVIIAIPEPSPEAQKFAQRCASNYPRRN